MVHDDMTDWLIHYDAQFGYAVRHSHGPVLILQLGRLVGDIGSMFQVGSIF